MILLFALLATSHCANVLVFNPTIGQSHVYFLGNIADILARDGHNVTILSVVVEEETKEFGNREKNIKLISFTSPYTDHALLQNIEFKTGSFWNDPLPHGQLLNWGHWGMYMKSHLQYQKGLLENKDLIQRLRDSHFDIGVIESYELGGAGFLHAIGVKTVMLCNAVGMTEYTRNAIGLPILPGIVPGAWTTFTDNMNFFDRVENLKFFLNMRLANWWFTQSTQELFEKYIPGFPDLYENLWNKTGVFLSNTNEFTETARPTTGMVQQMGGAHIYQANKLNEEFDTLLNLRKGNVFFSFGTYTQSCSIPKKIKQAFLDAFSRFPDHTFLWKYDACENDSVSFEDYKNVIPLRWVPQSDLLADERISLFITHGGMNSITEAGFRGKPILAVPLFADQLVNAKTAVSRGVGVVVDRFNVTADLLTDHLSKLLEENNIYLQNAQRMANILDGKEEEFREAIRKWARKLALHGRMEHLALQTNHLGFTQIYSIDAVGYLLVQLISVLVGIGYFIRMFFKRLAIMNRIKNKTE